MHFALFAAALAAVFVLCTEPAHSQSRPQTDEPICNFEKAPRVSETELKKRKLDGKLKLFAEATLETALKEVRPTVVVVACQDMEGGAVYRRHDYTVHPPKLISVIFYITVETLEKYDPD